MRSRLATWIPPEKVGEDWRAWLTLEIPRALSTRLAPKPPWKSIAATIRSACSAANLRNVDVCLFPLQQSTTMTLLKPRRFNCTRVRAIPRKVESLIAWTSLIFTRDVCSGPDVSSTSCPFVGSCEKTGFWSTARIGRYKLPRLTPTLSFAPWLRAYFLSRACLDRNLER